MPSTNSTAPWPEGIALYERANDARRRGDHEAYNRLIRELIAYNSNRAKAGLHK